MPEVRHSVCALDCPDCCSLLINVEDGRGSKLRGNPAHPITRGFLCGKVAQYLERADKCAARAEFAEPRGYGGAGDWGGDCRNGGSVIGRCFR